MPNARAAAQTGRTPRAGNLVVAGVSISHPDRVISEAGRITKGELAEYYGAVAPLILPGIEQRPISVLRCTSGFDGECFYQRHLGHPGHPGKRLGAHVHPFKFTHQGKRFEYFYVDDEKGLLELIQMGGVEIHP